MSWTWMLPMGAAATGGLVLLARRNRQAARSKGQDKRSYWAILRLADEARHIEALARVLASQAATEDTATQQMLGWVVRNRSIWMYTPLFALLAPGGEWGPLSDRRTFSTSQPAQDSHRVLARTILRQPQRQDPSGGATHTFDRALQDELAWRGLVRNDSAAVIAFWTEYHKLTHVKDVGTWTLYKAPKAT